MYGEIELVDGLHVQLHVEEAHLRRVNLLDERGDLA